MERVAHVVMTGSTVHSVFVNAEENDNNSELAAQQLAASIVAASQDNPQQDALRQATWIARVPLNPA